jgi:hypothetical protein
MTYKLVLLILIEIMYRELWENTNATYIKKTKKKQKSLLNNGEM